MLKIKMKDPTIKDIKYFVRNNSVTGKLDFQTKQETYNWIKNLLDRVRYKKLEKKEKGEVLIFLQSITDYEPSYIRKIVSSALCNDLHVQKYHRDKPYSVYNAFDVKLLANTDILHNRLSSPATKRILEREFNLYRHTEFKIISGVSTSHIYNLRDRPAYDCVYKNATQANVVNIGTTAKPQNNDLPGSIRIDTVHQRDIYYINAVDEITQWELVFAVPAISEYYLLPILLIMIESFPFIISLRN
jgi:hypothetical protein